MPWRIRITPRKFWDAKSGWRARLRRVPLTLAESCSLRTREHFIVSPPVPFSSGDVLCCKRTERERCNRSDFQILMRVTTEASSFAMTSPNFNRFTSFAERAQYNCAKRLIHPAKMRLEIGYNQSFQSEMGTSAVIPATASQSVARNRLVATT